jgi:drug/metabolite transporter (DMT)-like permease
MGATPAVAAAVILIGNFILSLGMTMQKLHIGWMDRLGDSSRGGRFRLPRGGGFYRDFWFWFLGLCLMNVVPAFQYFALLGLAANIVGAAAGASVAFTAVLSKLILKESMGRRRLVWTVLLFVGIAAAGFLGDSGSSKAASFSPAALYVFLVIPLAAGLALVALRGRFKGPGMAAAMAAVAGCFGGFMVFPMRAFQLTAGAGLAGTFASPYLYVWILAGFASFALTQLAYKGGEMSTVAPALYGMQVLWPALGSYAVFGGVFFPAQALAFAFVALCVLAIAGARPAAGLQGPLAAEK